MGIRARVIADSINPDGDRLTTVETVFNRWILAELNTHRMLSRNSASSRAIPVRKVLSQVWRDPAVPVSWGANQAGMQARSDLSGWRLWLSKRLFLFARIPALVIVWLLSKVGLHKQVANRILEPWVWHTAVISATEWENFFKLRLHPDAQPEFQELARCIKKAMDESTPKKIGWIGAKLRYYDMWHTPYIVPDDVTESMTLGRDEESDVFPDVIFMSVSRCAAVSYVRQNERDVRKDIKLSIRLRESGHWSPFEHVACAEPGWHGNFKGWKQLRKFYPGESGAKNRGSCVCIDSLYTDCPLHNEE